MDISLLGNLTIKKEDIEGYSPDIKKMLDYWETAEDITTGFAAIRDKNKRYLPSFSDESDAEYRNRLKLAKFTNVYRDVLEGLSSKPFENPVTLSGKVSDQINEMYWNIDGQNNNLTVFSNELFFNAINYSTAWIFVDYPKIDNKKIRTLADLKKNRIKPYWTHVLPQNVHEVVIKIIGGVRTITFFKMYEPDSKSYRIFESRENIVSWWLYTLNENNNFYDLQDQGNLTIDVIPFVPLILGRRRSKGFDVYPPMQDAVDLQVSLYQDESSLQFIKTMAGYPMLAANNMTPDYEADGKTPQKIAVGPTRILYGIPDGNGGHASWSYVEPSTGNMDFLQRSINQTKLDLRELGRQPLTAQSAQLTSTTTAVAAGKARSAVSAWAILLKDALENAFIITNKWLGINGDDITVNVYDDFDNFIDNDADLNTLDSMRTRGDVSLDTYWYELKRRKVLSAEFDADVEKKKLLDDIPSDETNLLINRDEEDEEE